MKYVSALCAAVVLTVINIRAAIPPVEKLLPDDTLMLFTTPDYNKLREIYKTSPQMQLWNEPSMRPFKEKFLAKLNDDLIQPLERELGIHLDDYTNLPQGQITFALTQNAWSGKEGDPGFLLLLDTKDQSGQLRKNLAELRKKWVDAGKPIKSEKIRNIDFFVLPISDKDVPKTLRKFSRSDSDFGDGDTNQAPKLELAIGQFESLLIIGNSLKPIEKVIVHLTGGAMPSLGDLAAYEQNRLALFRDAPAYGWVNAKGFVDAATANGKDKPAEDDPFAALRPAKIIAALGLNGLKTVAFSFQNSREGSLIQASIGVPEANRSGIFKIFAPESKESSPPPFVPADAAKFQRWRINGQKAWAALEKMINDFSPQGMAGINFMIETANSAAQEKDPGFDVRKNLIANLGDDFISYEKTARDGAEAGANSQPALFLIGSPNPDQFASALKNVLVLLSQNSSPTEREFLGRKIYSVPMPAMPTGAPAAKSAPRSLNYASSGGYVALAADVSILEEYLRSSDSQQKTLRETPGLTEAVAKVGGTGTGWFGYENQAETSRATFEALRKSSGTTNTSSGLMSGMGLPGTANPFKEWMDFSLLPPFEKISKYFYFTVYTGAANMDGMTFKVFAPVPPALKK
ncbi:MAG: hypothetical protein QOD03_1209 [Verrucomicrobiota bacterium]|jgi:hypothetical protein